MKPIFIILISFFVTPFSSSLSQTKQRSSVDSQSNFYSVALSIYLDTTYNSYHQIDTMRNWLSRIIQTDPSISQHLPVQINQYSVQYKTDSDLEKEFKSHKTRIPVTKIFPITNVGDTLVISFSDYWFTVEHSKYNYALEGGCNIYYVYDCTAMNYKLLRIELWGV
jgi:hypothetical protein